MGQLFSVHCHEINNVLKQKKKTPGLCLSVQQLFKQSFFINAATYYGLLVQNALILAVFSGVETRQRTGFSPKQAKMMILKYAVTIVFKGENKNRQVLETMSRGEGIFSPTPPPPDPLALPPCLQGFLFSPHNGFLYPIPSRKWQAAAGRGITFETIKHTDR